MTRQSLLIQFRNRLSINEGGEILMSWTKSICYFAFCALLAAPAMAAPTLSVTRSPGVSATGGIQWTVGVTPDTAMFSDPADAPDRGLGGATGIDVGFTLTGRDAATAVKNATNFDTDTPGNSTFGDETADGEGDFVGVQIGSNASNVYAGLGSVFFTSGGVKNALTIGTTPINTANLTSTIAWGGAYNATGDAGTTHGIIAQDGAHFGVSGSSSFTALIGDVNLDGVVNGTDLGILSGNWLLTSRHWGQGNFNGQTDNVVNGTDLGILSGNWLATSPGSLASGAVAIPEPSTLMIVGLGLAGLAYARRCRG
jgi:hypothetical protein